MKMEENYNFSIFQAFCYLLVFFPIFDSWGPDLRAPALPFIGRACWIAFRLSGGGLMGLVPGLGEITGTAGL